MAKNNSNELLDVLSILSLEMAKYNLSNNLEALKNEIENYKKKKLREKNQMEELQVNKQFLQVLDSKNKDNNLQSKFKRTYKRYNSSKLMKKYENNNKNNYSPKKSVDMTKDKYKIKHMLVEKKEKDDEKFLSPIKRVKRYKSRKSVILNPDLANNGQTNKSINKDLDNSKSNHSNNNNKIRNEKKDDSDTFTISESDNDSSSDKNNENTSEKISKNNNLENRNIENSQKVLKTYIKKLSSKFEERKVSFRVEDNAIKKSHRSNSRKNSILSEDVLKKSAIKINDNPKINNIINSNNNTNRISNLKNYKPNYQNNQNNLSNSVKVNNRTNRSNSNNSAKLKQKNSIESIKEKISIIAEENSNKEKRQKFDEKNKFKRGCKKHRTLYSTLTSPIELTNVIKDGNFMDMINDDFSSSDLNGSFTKEHLDVDLFSQQKQSFNNLESTNSYNNFYSSKDSDNPMQSSSLNSTKKKKKEKIIEETPFMKKYQISSSFAERQMKILQIKNNNINKLKIRLEKKNNFVHSPKINSNSQKLVKQKGAYIPIYKRSVIIQYDKHLKFNLFPKMEKDIEIKNEKSKGLLSYREKGKKNNNKIIKFFESQISWKEKVNSKTKKLKNNIEKEKENSLNEELLFKPIIFSNSEYKIKNKSQSIFMKLYNDQNIKEKKLEKLKKKLTPSFIPNINDEKRINYYNKKNNNILNNYSKFNMNNNNTSRLRNNISSNFKKINKILYYEEEDSSVALTNRLKGYENLEISKIKKDKTKKIEKDDTLESLTGLESDLTNNKFPNINESNSICLGQGFIYPDSDRKIIYNQYNNINNNYINYPNKSMILKNKIMYEKENRFNQKIEEKDEISNKSLFSYFKKNDIINPNKSMEIKSGNVKNYFNLDYEDSKFEKFRDNYNYKIEDELKSEILNKNKINNINKEKDDKTICFDLWNFNDKQKETVDERNEKDKKNRYNEYPYIMKEKKEKIKHLKYSK